MVEEISERIFSCKSCTHDQEKQNKIDDLIVQHKQIEDQCLNMNRYFKLIDQWEKTMINLVEKHAKDVKKKLISISKNDLIEFDDYSKFLAKTLIEKKQSNHLFENDLFDLQTSLEQFDQDSRYFQNLLHDITIQELNQIANKLLITNTIGQSYRWTYLCQIKLDSTYGYMSANDHQIFLGWKNRIVIYNLNGTKHDETRLHSVDIYGELCDIIWSLFMQGFFILCRKSLFVHYPSSNQIECISQISLMNQIYRYQSLTSFENNLIILNEQTLDLWKYANKTFHLDNSILITSIIKYSDQESICSIRANEDYLGILIQNQNNYTWRIDFYTIFPFQRFHLGKSFDHFNQLKLGSFLSLDRHRFLFMNWENKLMRLIDQNDSNRIIDYNAYNACLVGSQRKLIINYMTYLKIYEF